MNSRDTEIPNSDRKPLSTWVRVGAVAAGSALAGGIAAAWFYRKTLLRLRQAAAEGKNSDFGIIPAEAEDDF